jgi:hypothetical protein
MRFLVDENISRSKKFIKQHPEFTNTSDEIKPGAIDDEVEKASEKGYVLVTRDKRLVIKALIARVRVWYFDSNNIDHAIQATSFKIDASFAL